MILPILLGAFFGFALYYVGATENENILHMLRLDNLSLAKIIIGAIGFSSFFVGLLGMMHKLPLSHFSIKPMNIGVILGGIVFGIGFGLIGSCPGTALASLFTNFKRSVWIVFGGLVGAFLFSISYEKLYDLGWINSFYLGKETLFNILPDHPHLFSIGFIGLVLFGISLLVLSYILPISFKKYKNTSNE